MGNVFEKEIDHILSEENLVSLHSASGSWQADEDATVCLDCEQEFSLLLRKHHCRFCGRIFCHSCCSTLTGRENARTCDRCAERLEHHQKEIQEGKPSRIDLFPKRRNTKEVEQDKAKLLKQQAQEHQAAGLLTTVSQFFHSPSLSLGRMEDKGHAAPVSRDTQTEGVHLNGKSADFKFDPSKLNKVVMEPMCEHTLGNEAKEEDWGLVEREDGKSAVLSTEKNNDLDTTHSGQEESEEESEDEIVHF
eukprot:g1269.t1